MPSLYPRDADIMEIEKRITYTCPSGYTYDGYYCVSPWYLYGRWILVGALIIGAFLLFCIFSCITARRRKRRGLQPFRGTGWASGGPGGQPGAYPPPQNYYNSGYNYGQPPPQQQQGGWQQPPPQYGAPDGTHYGKANPEPYSTQPTELQSPGHAYQPAGGSYQQTGVYNPQHGGDQVYAPPAGPPPNKDGIIR